MYLDQLYLLRIFIQAYSALLRELRRYAQKGAYAQSGGSELPNTPFSF